MNRFFRSRILFALLLALSFGASVWGSPPQSSSPLTLAESPPVLSLAGGTLTVVLANKNGFVIATDSRSTFPDGRHADHSQKLFRLGPHSAMAIAGFADNTREPFLTDIAGEIIKATPDYRESNPSQWIEQVLGPRLHLLRLINWAEGGPPGRLDSYVTVATLREDGIPQIVKLAFDRDQKDEHPKVVTLTGVPFECVAFGITEVVDSVLAGAYDGPNQILLEFAAAHNDHSDARLSIHQLSKIAAAFIDETGRISSKVGGSLQMGVFEVKKEPDLEADPF